MARSAETKEARLNIQREYDNTRVRAGAEYYEVASALQQECNAKKATAWEKRQSAIRQARARRRSALDQLSGR